MGEWFDSLRKGVLHGWKEVQRTCVLCNEAVEQPASVGDGPTGKHLRYDLCPSCENQLFAQWGLPFQDYLDVLEAPVVVTDGDVVLKAANRAACALLGMEPARMEGLPGGLVFECEHALEPEGCGRTVHCSGCVIRHSVTDTYLNGTAHVRLPATLDRGTPEGGAKVRLLISTLRRENAVLLKIEVDPTGAD